MGARRTKKSLLEQTAEMREALFAKTRENSRVVPVSHTVRLRKREQESELKKWFCDTFDVNISGEEDFENDD